ncbi:MAG: gliding-motility protein MglA [Candidatus Hydrogenedentota bacterium]|jgi:signal recognition particle receptor subunit beta|uniref:Gliding motility protein MglA n=1 Tax=Sumerlaea chitinivorans TaxID=2250252 RepID=A0A2Z4Y127_SUMC1|nr:gliding motility protein MglA [Candidatus Sumerlaea chitinivorans]MCX7962956.1 GTPase domain-containing protein [Candidatus Sumerlaea chitinivorans]RMH23792.1 MAG: gliding-motility protein MglA [Candidatus Hydrogenedentota bacterium]GIX44849.1 MAG: MglA protein [Candidatus Sumerlaea sp.]
MPIINYRAREINCKIVYCGPSLGGKTTNIKAIHAALPAQHRSDLQIIDTADERTLFFDYFSLNVAQIRGMRARFLVYGVPGQDYYRATRKMVLQGVDGIVFVADSDATRLQDNIASLADMKALLVEHGYDYATIPLVFQFNKRDLPNILSVDELNRALNDRGVPSFEAIAIQSVGVVETFKAICAAVVTKLNEDLHAKT